MTRKHDWYVQPKSMEFDMAKQKKCFPIGTHNQMYLKNLQQSAKHVVKVGINGYFR